MHFIHRFELPFLSGTIRYRSGNGLPRLAQLRIIEANLFGSVGSRILNLVRAFLFYPLVFLCFLVFFFFNVFFSFFEPIAEPMSTRNINKAGSQGDALATITRSIADLPREKLFGTGRFLLLQNTWLYQMWGQRNELVTAAKLLAWPDSPPRQNRLCRCNKNICFYYLAERLNAGI